MSYRDSLGIDREEFEGVREHFERATYGGREYRYLSDARGPLERGTVLIDGVAVRGFPRIPRTLVLSEGVPQYFDGPVVVEEKLNGYNVRLSRVGGDVLAFTRGGFVCPFTTHEARERVGDALAPFFDAHPEAMLCAEAIGPENPYTAHDYPGVDSVGFRAFDVRDRGTGEPWPVARRRERCTAFGIPQAPSEGRFALEEAVDRLPEVIARLDEADREGVVLKSPDAARQLKYTTGAGNRGDLAYAFSLPFDYGREFVFRRLLREAFQSVEFEERGDDRADRARAIGEAILEPMCGTIERVADGETATERHTVRSAPGVIDDLLAHLRERGLDLRIERDAREDGRRVVTFHKEMRSTTDATAAHLDGRIVRE